MEPEYSGSLSQGPPGITPERLLVIGRASLLVNIPRYPAADYKGVTAPNADTLYTGAFLDVSKEPILLYPDMHGRYFLFPIYSDRGRGLDEF
jgi:hypothetical protein